jgi:N-acyl amino acid synthase of PEP-CTERM/exosortase system
MTPDGSVENFSALSGLYDRYFTVVPADTPALLDAAHALRYQVYCVEHAFEDPSQQIGERERDRYDDGSVHAVLIHNPTQQVVGCVRLILPRAIGGISSLPLRKLLNEEDRVLLDQCDPARTAEISRYAVSKVFRRRQDEEFFPDVHVGDLPVNEVRRLVPHMSLGLIRGVGKLAAEQGITTVCAAMAPALLRLLERFGLTFRKLGPPIDHHGIRQPCIAECEALLAGMAERHAAYHELVDAAYRGRKSA